MFSEIDGHSIVLAYTDVDVARAAMPETHRLFSIVVAELLNQVPPYVGVLIDPGSASSVHVPAERRQELIDAAQPFPGGATVRLGDPAREPKSLTATLQVSAPGVAPLRRLWRTWYQVADAPAQLLVIYDVEGEVGADIMAADAVVAAA
ncbi:MAG: enhanced serine sensitivity protein SseB C-terminal domain-containing protein, partial [Actinobacteria bacterium]|nr:enhanced serine sensitivity protein SseB C-terminal domain-containing protein [Actinomycetota bacterium]